MERVLLSVVMRLGVAVAAVALRSARIRQQLWLLRRR